MVPERQKRPLLRLSALPLRLLTHIGGVTIPALETQTQSWGAAGVHHILSLGLDDPSGLYSISLFFCAIGRALSYFASFVSLLVWDWVMLPSSWAARVLISERFDKGS